MKAQNVSLTTPDNETEDSMNDHITNTEASTETIADHAETEVTTAKTPDRAKPEKRTKPGRPAQVAVPKVRILKVSTCPSLSGRSELTYHVGCIGEAVQLRVYQNSGKGYFNQEWISYSQIMDALTSQEQVTAASLRSIFVGKSVNTAGFFLAVLKDLGLIEISKENRRSYSHKESAAFETETARLIASGVSIEVAEKTDIKVPTTKKGTLKLKPKKS